MKIVLDTNVLLVSIPKKSPFRPIFNAVVSGKIKLVITNEILSEYTEKIEEKANAVVAANISELLSKSVYVEKIDIYYKWNLITQDYDDNKFVDAAVTGNAHYIVTNDKHFNILKGIDFPKIEVISSSVFLEKLEE